MKVFNNFYEMEKYYDESNKTYNFIEDNKRLNIKLNFDLSGEYKIYCNDLIAKEINIKHIECNDLKAKNIYNSYGDCNIWAHNITCAEDLFASNILASNVYALNIYAKNLFCNNIYCVEVETTDKIECYNTEAQGIHSQYIAIDNIKVSKYCIAVNEFKCKNIIKLSDEAEIFCCKNDIEYVKEC